ncbi:MAG TPA: SLATT domain-containing protein, partial [Pyrinomonadaceae bacterium]
EKRNDARRRSIAHELSGEYHRHRGVQFGIAATTVSAIVGSAVFVALARTIGLNGSETISFPSGGWGRVALVAFGFLSILAPVLVGLQTYLNHPGQAAKHIVSSADYYRLRDRLDTFLSRYDGVALDDAKRQAAEKELEEISKEMTAVRKDSIPLTDKAFENADARLESTPA